MSISFSIGSRRVCTKKDIILYTFYYVFDFIPVSINVNKLININYLSKKYVKNAIFSV